MLYVHNKGKNDKPQVLILNVDMPRMSIGYISYTKCDVHLSRAPKG
jgi:hypothetical protein